MGGWFDDLVDNVNVFENDYNTFVDDGAALGAHLLVHIDITVADEMTFNKKLSVEVLSGASPTIVCSIFDSSSIISLSRHIN